MVIEKEHRAWDEARCRTGDRRDREALIASHLRAHPLAAAQRAAPTVAVLSSVPGLVDMVLARWVLELACSQRLEFERYVRSVRRHCCPVTAQSLRSRFGSLWCSTALLGWWLAAVAGKAGLC